MFFGALVLAVGKHLLVILFLCFPVSLENSCFCLRSLVLKAGFATCPYLSKVKKDKGQLDHLSLTVIACDLLPSGAAEG